MFTVLPLCNRRWVEAPPGSSKALGETKLGGGGGGAAGRKFRVYRV